MDISFEPLPLVIGVTGHRDLREADIPLLKEKVAAIFDELDRDHANRISFFDKVQHLYNKVRQLTAAVADAFSHANGLSFSDRMRRSHERIRQLLSAELTLGATPMIVLSSLAEGAGQLVAEVALKKKLRVIAPLPLPPDEYRRDFELQAVRTNAAKTFDDWIKRPGVEVQSFGEKRNLQYRRAGAFIARHCDVLIALWDGREDKDKSATVGTAEIVDFKRNGIPLHASGSGRLSLDAPEIGPVIHIVTPRASKKEDTTASVSVEDWGIKSARQRLDAARKRRAPDEEIKALTDDLRLWEFFEASVGQSREFNRAATDLLQSPEGPAKIEKSFLYLFDADEKKPVPPETEVETKAAALRARTAALKARGEARRYCDLYVVADNLAQDWQRVFQRDWRWLFGLGLIAFGCFEAFAHLAPIAHEWLSMPLIRIVDLSLLFGYIAAFAGLFALYPVAILREHQERFLDYRALAEALRVAVFWKLASIEGAADAYPIKMPLELAWVKTCLLVQEVLDKAAPPADGAAPPSLGPTSYDLIRRIWIKGQSDYFTQKGERHLKTADWWGLWSKVILFIVAIVALGLLALVLREVVDHGEPAHDLLLFVIGVLPGVAALFVGYSEKLAFSAMARQYERMAHVFDRAFKILPAELEPANILLVRDAVRELGIEAMRDNAEWVSTYRQRPISLPSS